MKRLKPQDDLKIALEKAGIAENRFIALKPAKAIPPQHN